MDSCEFGESASAWSKSKASKAESNVQPITRAELANVRSFLAIPKARSTFYTLCELEDRRMRTLLDNATPEGVVNEKSGWLRESVISDLR